MPIYKVELGETLDGVDSIEVEADEVEINDHGDLMIYKKLKRNCPHVELIYAIPVGRWSWVEKIGEDKGVLDG